MDSLNRDNELQNVNTSEISNEVATNENNELNCSRFSKFSIKISKKPVPATPRGVLAE